jgi:hypothetical protein
VSASRLILLLILFVVALLNPLRLPLLLNSLSIVLLLSLLSVMLSILVFEWFFHVGLLWKGSAHTHQGLCRSKRSSPKRVPCNSCKGPEAKKKCTKALRLLCNRRQLLALRSIIVIVLVLLQPQVIGLRLFVPLSVLLLFLLPLISLPLIPLLLIPLIVLSLNLPLILLLLILLLNLLLIPLIVLRLDLLLILLLLNLLLIPLIVLRLAADLPMPER